MNPTILYQRKLPVSAPDTAALATHFPSGQCALITEINRLIEERAELYGNFMIYTKTVPTILYGGEMHGYEFNTYEYYAIKALQKTSFMYCLLVTTPGGFETYRHISTIHEPNGAQIGKLTKIPFGEIVASTQP